MSGRTDADLIEDMMEACRRIAAYIEGVAEDDFLQDNRTQDAVIRNIEILGEAAKKVTEATKMRYEDVPWRRMAGARDRLIHVYFGINIDIIWQIATVEIQSVMEQLQRIQKDLQTPP